MMVRKWRWHRSAVWMMSAGAGFVTISSGVSAIRPEWLKQYHLTPVTAGIGVFLMVAAAVTWLFARADIPDLFPDILCEPATEGDLSAIHTMAADYFGPEISPLDLMLSWQRKNHTVFRVLIEKRHSTFATSRKIVGYYCVLPVRKTAYDRLISGKMTGSTITAEDIVLHRSAPYAVYLGGMAATGFRARGGLLMAIRMDIDASWNGRVKRFLTRPVTAQGLRLVLHHGFAPVDTAMPGISALYHRVEA
ncbi:MAG: hypothetical protein ACYDA7_05205 [Acidithiobacillus sp.]